MSKKSAAILLSVVLFSFLLLPDITSHLLAVTTTKNFITLSNSSPGTVTTHTISFTPSDTTDTVKYIKLQYATTATGLTAPTGLSMSTTPTVTVSNNGTSLANTATYSGGLVTITLTTATALSATGNAVSITIANVTNPNAGNFYVQITALLSNNTTVTDSGVTENTTVSGVVLTGTIDPSLTFNLTGVGSGVSSATTGAQNTTTGSTTATTISFGDLSNGTNAASQLITATTNANNGYSITLEENQPPTNPSATTIPDLSGNTTWVNGTTLGFGVNVTAGTNPDVNASVFTSNSLYAPVPINSPTLILATKTSQTNLAGDNEYVNYQVGINFAQNAGTYTSTLNYVITANF